MRFSEFRLLSAAPVPRGKNIWTFEGLLRNPLSSFPVRQVVVKHGKGLLLVSSFPPTEEVLAQLKGLGEVKLILAPNAMHCLWGGAMRDACPSARLVGPPNAAKRFPKLKWDAVIETVKDWERQLSETVGGRDVKAWTTAQGNPWMQELVLVHKPSKALIVTDLAFNFRPGGETPLPGGPLGFLFRNTYLSLAGGYRPCCCTKPFGILCKDADFMCAVFDEVLKENFDQVIVAHGDVVPAPGGKAAFRDGTAAFFLEVAERRHKRAEAGPGIPRGAVAAAAGAVVLAAAAAGAWRLAGSRGLLS